MYGTWCSWFAARGYEILVHFTAFGAVADDLADGFLDADPVISFCYGRRGFVDTAVRLVVHFASNLVLLLRVRDDFLTFQHQFLLLVASGRHELVVCCCTPETALLCSVCAIGILSVLEVEPDLVEALF